MVRFYLVLTLLGILLPYGAFVPWVVTNGLDLGLLFNDAVTNSISVFAWLDVVVSAVVLLVFIIVDGRRNKVTYRYFAVLCWARCLWVCRLGFHFIFTSKKSSPLNHSPNK
nr:DUF2834 domain-containing protein [Pseudoalteromonas sp. SG44-17]